MPSTLRRYVRDVAVAPPVVDIPTVMVPLTVALAAGLVNAAVIGTVFATVTDRVAVARPPAESCTVSVSVCGPSATLVVLHTYDVVLPLTVFVETTVPSTASWNVFETAVEPVTDIPTVVLPLTVAPEAGLVNVAVSTGVGDVVMPFFTVTLTVEPPVLFDESFTVATSGCVPSTTIFVSKGIETGPLLAVVVEPIALPPSVSVYVFVGAVLPSSHIVAHAVLLTVVPPVGCVTKTLRAPVVGGGVTVFDTVTVCVAVPVPPMGSVAVAVSVWLPLATFVVSQEKLGPVPAIAVPSTFTPYVYVVPKPMPLPPVADNVTVAVPVTVALAAGAAKLTVGFCEGGGVVVLLTVTGSVAVAVLPAESVTAAVSVWSPLGTVFVSHEYVGPVPGTVVVVVLPTVRLYV